MNVLFLSHAPHEAHRGFAESVGARIRTLNLMWYIRLTKHLPKLSYLYPILSIIYSLFVRVREDVILADGGSSLYVAAAITWRKPRVKLVLLDADLLFYNLHRAHGTRAGLQRLFLRAIDGVVSVSEENRMYASRFLDVPMVVCRPYPRTTPPGQRAMRKANALYVGRLDPEKRIDRVVQVARSSPRIMKLTIVGDGSLRPWVEEVAGKNPKVIYVGPKDNVAPYYHTSMFFVHLPDHDPYPTATMEALLGGCIPLVSRGVGTIDILDPLFIIDDPDDTQSISARIEHLFSLPESVQSALRESQARIPTKEKSLQHFREQFKKLLAAMP